MLKAPVERALYPFDVARRELLLTLQHVPVLRSFPARRDLRLSLMLSAHVLLAFTVAILCPALSLVLSPLILGVPHVAADVRYLVLRRSLPVRWLVVVASCIAGMLAMRAFMSVTRPSTLGLYVEHTLGAAWLLAAALLRPRASRLLPLMAAGILGAVALLWPREFSLALTHGHNLVALVAWLALYRWQSRAAWLAIGVVLLLGAWLATGAWVATTFDWGWPSSLGLHVFAATDWLAPGIAEPRATGVTMSFAFLQAVHYAIWLFAIPQDSLRREASLSFRMSFRALLRDFGASGLGVVLASLSVVAVFGALAPLQTRNVYLSLSTFHAWLELASLLFLTRARGLAQR